MSTRTAIYAITGNECSALSVGSCTLRHQTRILAHPLYRAGEDLFGAPRPDAADHAHLIVMSLTLNKAAISRIGRRASSCIRFASTFWAVEGVGEFG